MKSGHHGMDSLRVDPTHLVAKIGYQGIRCYVTATNSTLQSEEKLNESRYSTDVRNIEYYPLLIVWDL